VDWSCPAPQDGASGVVTLAVGEGGRLSRKFLREHILDKFCDPCLGELGDAAVLPTLEGSPVLTTTAPTRAANPDFYLNINQYQNLGQTKSDRQNWFNGFEYDLTDRVTAYADLSAYHSNSNLIRQPIPINAPSADQLAPLSVNNPYNPYGSRYYSPTGAPNAVEVQKLPLTFGGALIVW